MPAYYVAGTVLMSGDMKMSEMSFLPADDAGGRWSRYRKLNFELPCDPAAPLLGIKSN